MNSYSLILVKINIPGKVSGLALSIEPYSLYPYENEIILNPCYLKLTNKIIRKDIDIYEHKDSSITKLINTIYEFEYIKKYDIYKHFLQYNMIDNTILFINFYDISNKYIFKKDNTFNII